MKKLSNWYCVSKDIFERYDVPSLKRSLIAFPSKSSMTFGSKDPVVLYREEADHYCVPRAFGIDTFGKPDEYDLADSWDIDVHFTGTLDDSKNQNYMVDTFMAGLADKPGGILCSGTGSGKTVLALDILAKLKTHTLILVHKEFLMEQWFDRISQFLGGRFSVGKIQEGSCEWEKDIVIGMLQTLHSRNYHKRMYNSFGLVISDEVHRIGAPTFFNAMTRFNPETIIGVSATPDRADGLSGVFYKHIGPILARNKTLKMEGSVYQIGVDAKLKDNMFVTQSGKFNIARWVSAIARIRSRTEIAVEHAYKIAATGRKTIVLSHRREHVIQMVAMLKQRGVKVAMCMGGMKSKAVFKVFEENSIIVSTYQFVSEALDIPMLSGMVLATPASNITQAIGRLTRTHVDKKDPIVTELVDIWSTKSIRYANKHLLTYKQIGFTLKGTDTGD